MNIKDRQDRYKTDEQKCHIEVGSRGASECFDPAQPWKPVSLKRSGHFVPVFDLTQRDYRALVKAANNKKG